MDFLECKICNVPYDEEDHRPRHAPCGHEFCSACIKELIADSIFVCPKCRQKNKVNAPDDLPVSFGLIDVIRAFKTNNISLSTETKPGNSEATNYDSCKVHHKPISHHCLNCKFWICGKCIDSHTTHTGCSTVNSVTAMENMKEDNAKNIDKLLTAFDDDANSLLLEIDEHSAKNKHHLEEANKHDEERKKKQKILEQGKLQKEELLMSKNQINIADTPYLLMDNIEVLAQRKQSLHSWTIKNIRSEPAKDLQKALVEGKHVYVDKVFNNQKLYGFLSLLGKRIYFHTFDKHRLVDGDICIPLGHLQKLISEVSLVFLELSLGNVVKGRVLVRLNKALPNINAYMVQMFTGQCGPSLIGKGLPYKGSNYIFSSSFVDTYRDFPFTPDIHCASKANKGDVFGYFEGGYISQIYFFVDKVSFSGAHKFGVIEKGFTTLQECYNQICERVKITDCGIVFEQDLKDFVSKCQS